MPYRSILPLAVPSPRAPTRFQHSTLVATGFAVIALLLNYMVMERSMRNAAADDAVANIANINSPFAAKMDLVVSSVARVLQIVDEIPVEQNPAGLASLRQAMATASKYSAVPISFGITDSTGRTIANSLTTDALSINVSDRDFFKFFARSDSDTLYIGQPISTRLPWGSSQRALPFSRALRDSTGRFQGIAVAVTPVDFLEDFFSAAAPDGRTVGIYRNEGELLVHMSSKAGVSGDEAAAIAKAVVAEQSSEGRSREVKVGDRTFFVAWLGVTGTDIGVFTALEERFAISAWHDALWQRAGIFAMMAFAMLAGGAAVDSGRSQRSQRETAATALSHAAFSAISDPLLLVDNDNRLLLVN